MGQPYTRSRYYHLYINGHYWGLFQTQERSEASYAASYFGGDDDDYDVVKSAGDSGGYEVEATDGNLEAYHRLYEAFLGGFADNAAYYRVQGMNLDGSRNPEYERLVDVDNLIDFMLINYYTGDSDGPGSLFTAPKPNNFFGTYNRNNPDGFKWYEHDSEHAMDRGADNLVTPLAINRAGRDKVPEEYFNPHWLHEKLTENAEYRQRFADRTQRHFFHGGVLTTPAALASLDARAAEIETAMIAESARWGDALRLFRPPLGMDDWHNAVAQLRAWVPGREDAVLGQLRAIDWFPEAEPPSFSQHGGVVPLASTVSLTARAGTIYYTTDGTDPRQLGGGTDPAALEHRRGGGITDDRPRAGDSRPGAAGWRVERAERSDVHGRCSADQRTAFQPAGSDGGRTIGESGFRQRRFRVCRTGEHGRCPAGPRRCRDRGWDRVCVQRERDHVSGSGAVVLVVRNQEAFTARYGAGLPVAGAYMSGGLRNSGERIVVVDHLGVALQQFSYGTDADWPVLADGHGSSLEVVDLWGDYSLAANWRASSRYGGSPGVASAAASAGVVINEVRSRGEAGEPDLIELYNGGDHEVDLSGWFVTDEPNDLAQAVIPAGRTLAAGGYLVFSSATLGFDLAGAAGGTVWLIETDAHGAPVRFVDHARFAGAEAGMSLGRWPGSASPEFLLPMAGASFGSANVGPAAGSVVISEVHYQPSSVPLLAEDFSSGTAAGFTPVWGTWSVRDGGYEVIPGVEADTVTTLTSVGRLPVNFRLSSTLQAHTVAGFKLNGMLVFDYRSPTDFKFVSMHAGGGKWRIGERDATGWHFLAEGEGATSADTNVRLSVEIYGTSVVFRSPGGRLLYDFGTPLNAGQVGLASKDGTPRFEEVRLEWLGDTQALEFVELAASGDLPVDLTGWQLTGDVALEFAPGTVLGAGETLVVLGFDPAEAAATVASVEALLDMEGSVVLVGPYAGRLGDRGGTVRLQQPVSPENGRVGFALVDQVTYAGHAPWPVQAAGLGASLQRVSADSFGQAAQSWRGGAPTPGEAAYVFAGDMDLNGVVDEADVAGFALALVNARVYESTHGVAASAAGDIDGDGDVDFDDIDDFRALLVAAAPVATDQVRSAESTESTPAGASVSEMPAGAVLLIAARPMIQDDRRESGFRSGPRESGGHYPRSSQ